MIAEDWLQVHEILPALRMEMMKIVSMICDVRNLDLDHQAKALNSTAIPFVRTHSSFPLVAMLLFNFARIILDTGCFTAIVSYTEGREWHLSYARLLTKSVLHLKKCLHVDHLAGMFKILWPLLRDAEEKDILFLA